jgi:hypothetical protein
MVLAFVAVVVPVLFGILGLVVDNGYLYVERRTLQSGADAVAMAAAQELRRDNSGFKARAIEEAKRVGLHQSDGTQITINRPPSIGKYAGQSDYVEVTVQRTSPLFFMRAFGKDDAQVTARSVAGVKPPNGCIYALNPTAQNAFDASGDTTVYLPSCTIEVRSNDAEAAVCTGSASVTALQTNVVGDYTGAAWFPIPNAGMPAFEDPLALVPEPTYGGCDYVKLNVTGDTTISPGVYCDGIKVKKGTLTLQRGNYILVGGGIEVKSDEKGAHPPGIIGDGVMIYITASSSYKYEPTVIDTRGTVRLTAPKSGTYRGVLFFNDRSITESVIAQLAQKGTAYYEGALYFPGIDLKFTGFGDLEMAKVVLIADTVALRGSVGVAGLGEGFFPIASAMPRIVE